MDSTQKMQMLAERRRKKQAKLEKEGNRITEVRNLFLNAQHCTPDVFTQQEVYLTIVQKRILDLCKEPPFLQREFVNVHILHGNSPKEVFVIRKMDIDDAERFHNQLTSEYQHKSYELVYCLKTGFICVAKTTKGWQRCRILKSHKNSTCDVLLFDIGIIERVNWLHLYLIGEQFITVKPFAVRCTLVDIKMARPLERFSLQNHGDFLKILKDYDDFYIFVNESNAISSGIFLYYKFDGEFHCVNQKLNVIQAISVDSSADETISERNGKNTSNDTKSMSSKDMVSSVDRIDQFVSTGRPLDKLIDNCQFSKPFPVVIKHIVSIDEIYVRFVKYQDAYNALRFDIRKYVSGLGATPATVNSPWQIGDYCLIKNADHWFRGKIVAMKSWNTSIVFFRDTGKTAECHLKNLMPISKDLQNVRDFTWKFRMSSVKISNGCSTTTVNKMLRNIADSYEEMAISAVRGYNGNEYGIILWGVNRIINALLPERIEYVNINEELVKRNVAIATLSFDGIIDIFNPSQQKENEEVINSFYEEFLAQTYLSNIHGQDNPIRKQNIYRKVSDRRTEVKNWLPSEKIEQNYFVAFPMYVSQKLTISVLEESRKTTAMEIEDILQKKYRKNELECRDAIDWKKDDACFAQYNGGNYYRATLRRVNFAKNTCVVRFIDYGNCESAVSLDRLKKATMFGDIPVLIRQYQLHNIQSITSDQSWPDYVRQYCERLILERQCDLYVVESSNEYQASSEVEYCKLDLLTKYKDLATALVAAGYAKLIQ